MNCRRQQAYSHRKFSVHSARKLPERIDLSPVVEFPFVVILKANSHAVVVGIYLQNAILKRGKVPEPDDVRTDAAREVVVVVVEIRRKILEKTAVICYP